MAEEWQLRERDTELTVLSDGLGRAQNGYGACCQVHGAAGIGKSRLLAELRDLAQHSDFRVLSARGSELERPFAFGVVRQLFESAVAADRENLLAGAAGQAGALMGRDTTDRSGDMAVLHGLYWLTVNLSEQRPVMLLLDDLHWADTPSLRFLSYLLPRLDGLRVLVVSALRTERLGQGTVLLNQIVTDPLCTVLRLAPLSEGAAGQLLGPSAEPAFVTACHTATGGNPLFLRELTSAMHGVAPTEANAGRVIDFGPQALARHVELRLAQLPEECARLANAVAVLGDHAELLHVMRLAELSPGTAARALRVLERAELVRRGEAAIDFVHPLVRTAVYDSFDAADRLTAHRRAAELMVDDGAPAEQVAAHLLHVSPAGDPCVATVLRRAAAEALQRGSNDSAYVYLRRCAAEPPPADERLDVLCDLGTAALSVDVAAAADHLGRAFTLATDPVRQGGIAYLLGLALYAAGRTDDAATVLITAIGDLPAGEVDLARRLEAVLLTVPLVDPDRQDLTAFMEALQQLPPDDGAGGRMLDCVMAEHRAQAGDAEAVAQARRGLSPGLALWYPHAEVLASHGWSVLLGADADEAMTFLDAAVADAHRRGVLHAAAVAHAYRALGGLRRGNLAEAEADALDAVNAIDSAGVEIFRPLVAWWHAEILARQGKLVPAQAALDWGRVPDPLPRSGVFYQFLAGRAYVARLLGHSEQALQDALEVGRRSAAVGRDNPALMPWRSEAALCLNAMGRDGEAQTYAAVEVVLARRWGAPRALGRALRVAGIVEGRTDGALQMLRESVTVLENSPARLEHAEALVDLGAAVRRLGERAEARTLLSQGAQLAELCGAVPLGERALEELTLAGARRRTAFSGPAALTPGERRVADLAAAGQSNRVIAQALFVTPKTVELHLSNVYRKLAIAGRHEIAGALRS